MKFPRGVCPRCGRNVALNAGGLCRKHRAHRKHRRECMTRVGDLLGHIVGDRTDPDQAIEAGKELAS